MYCKGHQWLLDNNKLHKDAALPNSNLEKTVSKHSNDTNFSPSFIC